MKNKNQFNNNNITVKKSFVTFRIFYQPMYQNSTSYTLTWEDVPCSDSACCNPGASLAGCTESL